MIEVHLIAEKKFDKCLLTGWSSTVFILLVNIFNHTFNLFINNIVRKPIIDEGFFLCFLPLSLSLSIYIYIYIYISNSNLLPLVTLVDFPLFFVQSNGRGHYQSFVIGFEFPLHISQAWSISNNKFNKDADS